MFDWIPELLYFISRTILQLVDGLIACANILCGIEPITVGEDKNTNFLLYIFKSEDVRFAFRIALVLGLIVLVFATIYAIFRNLTKEKPELTPGQTCIKAAKTLLTFLFIPLCMSLLIWIGNEFVKAIYSATSGGTTELGAYLFTTIGDLDGLQNSDKFLDGTYSYTDIETVWTCIDLWDFNHFLVWLVGGIILFNIITSLMQFIDRIISIMILFIVSPFSVASSILDDGARFKLWRDQVLVKFFTSYGMILALNIFVMLTRIVINPEVIFFESGFLNFCMKVMVILGGAFGLNRAMALIGNLISSGAGFNEMRDAAQTSAKFRGALTTPLNPLGITSEMYHQKKRDLAGRGLSAIGLGMKDNGQRNENGEKDVKSSNDESNQNNKNPKYNDKNSGVSMAIANLGGVGMNKNENKKDDENKNDKKGNSNGNGSSLINNSINDSLNRQNNNKGDEK